MNWWSCSRETTPLMNIEDKNQGAEEIIRILSTGEITILLEPSKIQYEIHNTRFGTLP